MHTGTFLKQIPLRCATYRHVLTAGLHTITPTALSSWLPFISSIIHPDIYTILHALKHVHYHLPQAPPRRRATW